MSRRLYIPREVHAYFEAKGFDYSDVLDAMDEVVPSAETADHSLFDQENLKEIQDRLYAIVS